MYGLPEMAAKTMTVTAMAMPLQCGLFPSIPQLTQAKMPITMRAVHLHWHLHSPMVPKIPIQE